MENNRTPGLAVASLVIGIIALGTSFLPLLNIFSFPLVLLAIIFGAIGLGQALQRNGEGKGTAIAGLALGLLSFLITVVAYVFVF